MSTNHEVRAAIIGGVQPSRDALLNFLRPLVPFWALTKVSSDLGNQICPCCLAAQEFDCAPNAPSPRIGIEPRQAVSKAEKTLGSLFRRLAGTSSDHRRSSHDPPVPALLSSNFISS